MSHSEVCLRCSDPAMSGVSFLCELRRACPTKCFGYFRQDLHHVMGFPHLRLVCLIRLPIAVVFTFTLITTVLNFFSFPIITLHNTVSGSTLRVSHRDNQRVGIETVYWISQVSKCISSYMPQFYFNFASPSHPYLMVPTFGTISG